MNKKEMFERSWIPVLKRIPPDDETRKRKVLVFVPALDLTIILEMWIAHINGKSMLEKTLAPTKIYTHWMEIHKPTTTAQGDDLPACYQIKRKRRPKQ